MFTIIQVRYVITCSYCDFSTLIHEVKFIKLSQPHRIFYPLKNSPYQNSICKILNEPVELRATWRDGLKPSILIVIFVSNDKFFS